MTKRTVQIAIMAYQPVKGGSTYGFNGQEVDVHDDDLERFDSLNGENTTPVNEGPHPEVFLDVSHDGPHPQPDPTDHGAGGPEGDFERPERDEDVEPDGLLEEPSRKALLSDWQAYARQEGVDTQNPDGSFRTKRELVSDLTGD